MEIDFSKEVYERAVNYHNIKTMVWPIGDEGAYDGPLQDWQESHEDFLKEVASYNVVIQAGGCCGMYPLLYSQYFKHVYTFEPSRLNFYCLEQNCKDISNIKYVDRALHSGTNVCTMNVDERNNVGVHNVNAMGIGDVKMMSLDQLYEDYQIQHCDLIHLDTESHERYILLGAENTIKKYKPVIILEDQGSDCSETLNSLDYKLHKVLRLDRIWLHEDHPNNIN